MTNPLVVGVDGSPGALSAVYWAAREAHLLDAPLMLLHASRLLIRDGTLTDDGYDRQEAERSRMLGDARDRVLIAFPDLTVDVVRTPGDPGPILVDSADRARMIVVGARGVEGFEGLLLGSVSLYVAAHASCPIVVMPHGGAAPDDGRIVLGVDERHKVSEAIGWAFAEADRRRVPLTALHGVNGFGAPRQEIGEQMVLSEALAGWEPKYPDVAVTHEVTPVGAAKGLVEASRSASLVVLGARRRRGPVGMALGRVNHAVLHHSACPVVIVPEH